MRRAVAAFVALAACDDGGGSSPGPDASAEVDTSVLPIDWCDDAPVLSWDNFGQGFMVENCQPCHASTAAVRHDAPDDVTFDTPADIALFRDRILLRATGPTPEMPPAGGVSLDDRALLEAWLRCDVE
ncbi:MAG: hypothetical protein U1F43_23015 [Myxococcota bacterium]